jgi:ATP-dependent RNA helicase DDX10/DBP4
LSLKDPEYISAHNTATPNRLVQTYLLCEQHEKINVLFSFLKSHPMMKGIIFVNTCKEVRYYYEIFKRLKGISNHVEQLHGRMQQHRRTAAYYDFLGKQSAVMFATDVAARGLDFPDIDWVIQLDCPEDVETYIHRVGRTARYKNNGKALLMLSTSEEKFVERLQERKIEAKKVATNPSKLQNVTGQIEAILAEDGDLKYIAQKAFITYMRSIFLQKDKEVFQIEKVDAQKFSESMGLPGAPKIKMIESAQAKKLKNMNREMKKMLKLEEEKEAEAKDKVGKLLVRKNRTVYDPSREKLRDDDEEDSDDEDILKPRAEPSHHEDVSGSEEDDSSEDGSDDDDDDDNEEDDSAESEVDEDELIRQREMAERMAARKRKIYLASEAEVGEADAETLERYSKKLKTRVEEADPLDKLRERERVRELHRQQKEAERGPREDFDDDEGEAEYDEQPSDDDDVDQDQ